MLIEILHIPEEVPGVQAVKSDLAASSEKKTNPNRECQFSNSKSLMDKIEITLI